MTEETMFSEAGDINRGIDKSRNIGKAKDNIGGRRSGLSAGKAGGEEEGKAELTRKLQSESSKKQETLMA
jgi:hypothetical protein